MSVLILLISLLATQPVPRLAVEDWYLTEAGKRYRVQSISTGQRHPLLQRLAEEHAEYQARIGVQGHQYWERRFQQLNHAIPGLSFSEVANESWPDQNVWEAALEMYNSWRKSSGHWRAVNSPCVYYGYAMRLGRNGTWYACGIFGQSPGRASYIRIWWRR